MKLEVKQKGLIAAGIDPVVHKRKTKHAAVRNAKSTFKAIALDWYDNRKSRWKPRYAAEIIKRLESDIFPSDR